MKIKIKNLTKKFQEKTIWSNLNLDIDEGKLTAITGESGSGKTTLLNCIGMLEKVTEGSIYIGNFDITKASPKERKRCFKEIFGFIFQNYGLIENWSIKQNLEISLEHSKLQKRQKAREIKNVLNQVNLDYLDKETKVYSLSGGEQQRVALARVLLKQHRIILCDEPSAALDDNNTQMVLDVLKESAKNGVTVIISTHDERVTSQCDEIIRLG